MFQPLRYMCICVNVFLSVRAVLFDFENQGKLGYWGSMIRYIRQEEGQNVTLHYIGSRWRRITEIDLDF